MRYNHQKKEKKKEGFGRVSAQLRKKWGHKDRGQRNGLDFISTASRTHPTRVLLVVPQRGPRSHLSTPLCSCLLCLEHFPSRVQRSFLSPFISEPFSHITQPESYFTHQTTHFPLVIPSPCSPAPHTTSITTSKKWIISTEKSIVGTEWMNDGRNEEGKLQKSVWWNIYFWSPKGQAEAWMLPTHLIVE